MQLIQEAERGKEQADDVMWCETEEITDGKRAISTGGLADRMLRKKEHTFCLAALLKYQLFINRHGKIRG